jgi:Protein of unknown function (DUF4239)
MTPLFLSWIILSVVFVGAVLGMALRRWLPEENIGESSKDIVRLVMGLIATLAALVLGLLVASAKSSYDTQSGELVHAAAQIIQLDRLLAVYGPEASDARVELRSTMEQAIDRVWPSDREGSPSLALPASTTTPKDGFTAIANLEPHTAAQRFAQSKALDVAAELSETRVLLYEQSGRSIPVPFLVVLVFWLVIIFMAFGLFAPTNATVLATLFVGSMSVAGAIFLILELDQPFAGLMRLSSAPLRAAVAHVGI